MEVDWTTLRRRNEQHCQTTVDSARSQRKRTTKEYLEKRKRTCEQQDIIQVHMWGDGGGSTKQLAGNRCSVALCSTGSHVDDSGHNWSSCGKYQSLFDISTTADTALTRCCTLPRPRYFNLQRLSSRTGTHHDHTVWCSRRHQSCKEKSVQNLILWNVKTVGLCVRRAEPAVGAFSAPQTWSWIGGNRELNA